MTQLSSGNRMAVLKSSLLPQNRKFNSSILKVLHVCIVHKREY